MSMVSLVIELLPLQKQDCGWWRLGCLAQWNGTEQERGQECLWYEIETMPGQPDKTQGDAEPFLLAYLFDAMQAGADIHVHGRVSARLLENLAEFQQVWRLFRPGHYRPVQITADEISNPMPIIDERTAILPFSGGLDSSYTLWSHHDRQRGYQNRRIVQTFLVHGFDIPLSRPEEFAKAFASARMSMESLDLPFARVRTNFREIMRSNWEHNHSAALTSIGCFFKHVSQHLLLPAGWGYVDINWGSNPVTDPLLSSSTLRVLHDGGCVSPLQKAKVVASWSEGYQRLRVCWEGGNGENCGTCEKCVNRKLLFAANGIAVPLSLEGKLRHRDMATLLKTNPGGMVWLYGIRNALLKRRQRPAWYTSLVICLHLARLRIFTRRLFRKPETIMSPVGIIPYKI